ncbi:MAG: hypothetical protein APG12_01513 [Candidatus Methanofastidiosum methylothiophilum]|nr:MAG: hypothetical protein APG12_01513 [Candidatus Methanofastidiosum methylthiophilus]
MIKKRTVLKLILGGILIFIMTFAFLLVVPQMEKLTGLETINPEGKSGKVLVVYHPGVSSFQKDVTMSFVRGLVEIDYVVDITTPSSKTTTEIANYDLVVLGAPTYGFAPAKPIENYIKRVADFKEMRIVSILTGAGSTDESVEKMKELILMTNGRLIKSLPLWSSAPNEEIYGISDAKQIAYKAGLELEIN